MKAAVITLHNVCNYGTQLQAFATQEKLKEYFDDVVFIDYRRPDTYGRRFLRTFTKGNPLKIPAILPTLLYYKMLFGGFRRRHINMTERVYLTDKDLETFEDVADVYFSGSDQVWNTGWNGGVIPAFYLSFVPEGKPRYAYASSFGKSRLDEREVAESRGYIERYRGITVREDSGVSILREQYGYAPVSRILDPTLAMPADFWRERAPKSRIGSGYILVYNLNRSAELDRYAVELARRTGCRLYRLCTRLDQIVRPGRSVMMPPIFEFVTLIDNARLVLTDSFHATAFSMNLGTEPICVYPEAYASRIADFLKLVGAEHRHIRDFNDFDVLDRRVDFDAVNRILAAERKKTDVFLNEIINTCKQ